MWNWDQGRISYFQFDAIRAMARFVVQHDLISSDSDAIRNETGLDFLPIHYAPWRNYARVFKLCLLVSEDAGKAVHSGVAEILADTGMVTCDEYFHFLAQSTMDPSPALKGWNSSANVKYPLLFSLKYILARLAAHNESSTSLNEIIGAYQISGFSGDEGQADFVTLLGRADESLKVARRVSDTAGVRQARESIKVMSQISYLTCTRSDVICSLNKDDALDIFREVEPHNVDKVADGDAVIRDLASRFRDGSNLAIFNYESSTLSNEIESGFIEGAKVKRAHIVVERNSSLREAYFAKNHSAVCDACKMDTKSKYPWTERVLDLHHILPLSSGTRADSNSGTLLDDLVGICPTCHRAVHRYYDKHLKKAGVRDFDSRAEALDVYEKTKLKISQTR